MLLTGWVLTFAQPRNMREEKIKMPEILFLSGTPEEM